MVFLELHYKKHIKWIKQFQPSLNFNREVLKVQNLVFNAPKNHKSKINLSCALRSENEIGWKACIKSILRHWRR